MKASEDKHLEKLVDKMMKNQTLETPSFDFTSKVMNQVLESKKNKVFTYRPLISKQTAFAIFGITVLIIIYAILNANSSSSKWISMVDLSPIFKNGFSELFNFSTITMYGTVFGTIMLLAQITFLQNHFNNKN